jgi:hypothetical protein
VFGIAPQPLEAVVPSYLGASAQASHYDAFRGRVHRS